MITEYEHSIPDCHSLYALSSHSFTLRPSLLPPQREKLLQYMGRNDEGVQQNKVLLSPSVAPSPRPSGRPHSATPAALSPAATPSRPPSSNLEVPVIVNWIIISVHVYLHLFGRWYSFINQVFYHLFFFSPFS